MGSCVGQTLEQPPTVLDNFFNGSPTLPCGHLLQCQSSVGGESHVVTPGHMSNVNHTGSLELIP